MLPLHQRSKSLAGEAESGGLDPHTPKVAWYSTPVAAPAAASLSKWGDLPVLTRHRWVHGPRLYH